MSSPCCEKDRRARGASIRKPRQDWRSRNRIKNKQGVFWLTVPCGGNRNRLVSEVSLDDHGWQNKHWTAIRHSYAKAAFFKDHAPFFEDFYLNHTWRNLSEMNQYLIKKIAREILGITTEFDDSIRYGLREAKGGRIIELLKKAGATEYLSGPLAKDYLDPEVLAGRLLHQSRGSQRRTKPRRNRAPCRLPSRTRPKRPWPRWPSRGRRATLPVAKRRLGGRQKDTCAPNRASANSSVSPGCGVAAGMKLMLLPLGM